MQPMTRRQLLQWAGCGAATLSVSAGYSATVLTLAEEGKTGQTYPFMLPKLPYAFDALEPSIDARTMEIHHDRHHKGYVDGLNAALKSYKDLHDRTLVELVSSIGKLPLLVRTAVRNAGGGHLNHSMFWQMMAKGGGEPKGELAKAIDAAFGSLDKFKDGFGKAALGRFGSGWAWLVHSKGKLSIMSTPNQNSPVTEGATPLLGLDVWEHAYYLKYQNKRGDYVKAWWNVVNWNDVAARYAAASK